MAVRNAERWLMLRLRRAVFWRARLRACGELATVILRCFGPPLKSGKLGRLS